MRLAPLVSIPLLAALIAAAACSNQGEGEPCDPDNGSNDCQDGFGCVVPPNPNATNAPHVCCPGAGQAPSTPECTTNGAVDSGNPAPPDGSTMPESATGTDSRANDSNSEVSVDSSSGAMDSSMGDSATDGGVGGDASEGG